jgi:hypothetical protein
LVAPLVECSQRQLASRTTECWALTQPPAVVHYASRQREFPDVGINDTNRASSELGVGLGGEGADLLGRSHSGESESEERGAGEHGERDGWIGAGKRGTAVS